MKELTDSEFAVTLDSLSHMREWIKAQAPAGSTDTPNIDSAMAKLTEGITPATNGLRFELIQPEPVDPPESLENPDNYRGPDGVLGNDFSGPAAAGW